MASELTRDIFILFIHGSWHTPAFFEPIIQYCREQKQEAACPHLPTCDPAVVKERPNIEMIEDAKAIQETLNRLVIEEGKKVVIVAHSYGSVPATEAATRKLSAIQRGKEWKPGGIVGVLHLAGLMIQPGTCLKDLNKGDKAQFVIEDFDGTTTACDPIKLFLNDIDSSQQQYWADKMVPQPRTLASSVLNQAVYDDFPIGYVVLDNDQATPVIVQELCIKLARNAGVNVHEYHLPNGHSPYLSHPKLVYDTIKKFTEIGGTF